jgi:two-component system nitrate/nitrite response regulator NarL
MSSPGAQISILIADSQPIFREGLRRALEAEPDLRVVGETGDGDEAVRLAQSLDPSLLLLDPEMPRTDGLEAVGRMAALGSGMNTILLTANLDRDQLVTAVRLGVHGVVSKSAPTEIVLKAIRSVMAGQFWLGREEVADVVRSLLRNGPATNGRNGRADILPLTPREREVVTAVVQGFSNRGIAEQLKVSEDTVKHHLTNVYDKLGVSSRVELVVYALSHGLVGEG